MMANERKTHKAQVAVEPLLSNLWQSSNLAVFVVFNRDFPISSFFPLFKIPLSPPLFAIHFTANSYNFETFLLLIISLLWLAALLLSMPFIFVLKLHLE